MRTHVGKFAVAAALVLGAAGGVAPAVAAGSERGANLIRNSDFAEPLKRPWSLSPGVVRKETAALSGDWTLSALGKNYHIIGYFDPDLQWEADEAFTLAIDLRSVGSGSTLMLIHRYDKPDGSLGEGWAKRVQPSSDWHEYVIPFRTTKGGRPRGFSFFKIDNGAHDTGIEIRSFKMYRGKVSALDFVPVGRNARAGVLPGSALPVRPSLYGRAAKPLSALVVVNSLKAVREVQHLFAGTGAAAHVLVAEGTGASTFMTDDDPKEIRRRLETGGYDLYAFGRDAARGVGEELFKLVESNVRAGASAYFAFAPAQSGDAGLLAEVMAAKDGRYGKGRVTVDPCRKGIDDSWPRRAFIREGPLAGEYAIAAFPYEEVEMARVTDRLWRAAFGAPDLASARQAVEETVYRGQVHAVTRHVDAQGRTLAFACAARPVPGASLGDLADTGRDVEIPVSNCTMTARLKWRFSDFSGRVFGEGTASGPVARLAVPRERLFTSFGLLEVELTDGGAVADRRNYMVVEALVGAGTFVKKGTGTLTLLDPTAFVGTVSVEEGTFALSGTTPATFGELVAPEDLLFHVDAGQGLTTVTNDDGRVEVTEWKSTLNNGWAAVPFDDAHRPTLMRADDLNRRDVVDMAKNAGQAMRFTQNGTTSLLEGIASAFWVIGSQNGGGYLLGGGHHYDNWNGGRFNFMRGGSGGACADDPILSSNWVCPDNLKTADWRLDGAAISPTVTGLSGAWDLVSMNITDTRNPTSNADGFAFDGRTVDNGGELESRLGCQRLAEVILYSRRLTDAERESVEAYLRAKWRLGGTLATTNLMDVALAAEATLDLGGRRQYFASVTGAGTIRNGTLALGTLIADPEVEVPTCAADAVLEVAEGQLVLVRNAAVTRDTVLTVAKGRLATSLTRKRLRTAVFAFENCTGTVVDAHLVKEDDCLKVRFVHPGALLIVR